MVEIGLQHWVLRIIEMASMHDQNIKDSSLLFKDKNFL
jgi:hypothetical protein